MQSKHLAMLRAASWLVPTRQRQEWMSEWTAELWHLEQSGSESEATAFCSGAFCDGFFLLSQTLDWRKLGMSGPIGCLAILMLEALAAAFVMWASPAVQESVWDRPLLKHGMLALSALGLYVAMPATPRFIARGARGWCFMTAKLAILAVVVYFAVFDIVPVISRAPIQPQIAFVAYVVAFRWAATDQRRRCPTCLRCLTNPVRIGHPAGTLLGWYGEELVCADGHGVLHEPEPLESSYCGRRWVTPPLAVANNTPAEPARR